MDKYLVSFVSVLITFVLSGCVTQNYENDKSTPVVENQSTNNEMAMTRISLGLGYLKMGNTTQAKLNLEKAKRFAPNLVQVHTAFAHYFDSVGEPEQAISSYENALSIDGNDADTLNNYGVFLCKQKKYQSAEKHILKAIVQPSYLLVSKSYENLALCQLKARNFNKAELYFEKAISHSPNSASSLLHMIRLQYAKSDFPLALVYLKRYEKASRRFSADALSLAFKIYEKSRKYSIAKNYAGMLVKMFPNSYEAKQYLLSGLQEIEADNLARQYQQSIRHKQAPKKRIVVLSPNKPATSANKKPVPIEKVTRLPVKANKQQQVVIDNNAEAIKPGKPFSKQTAKQVAEKTTQKNIVENELPKPKASSSLLVHHVVKGDNLFSISKKYNIHMKTIERWNGLSRTKVIKIGDIIYLSEPKQSKNLKGNS